MAMGKEEDHMKIVDSLIENLDNTMERVMINQDMIDKTDLAGRIDRIDKQNKDIQDIKDNQENKEEQDLKEVMSVMKESKIENSKINPQRIMKIQQRDTNRSFQTKSQILILMINLKMKVKNIPKGQTILIEKEEKTFHSNKVNFRKAQTKIWRERASKLKKRAAREEGEELEDEIIAYYDWKSIVSF